MLDSESAWLTATREAWRRRAIERLDWTKPSAMALGTFAAPGTRRPRQPTPREVEVAQLVALGKSNREIVECLTVASGTAQRHARTSCRRWTSPATRRSQAGVPATRCWYSSAACGVVLLANMGAGPLGLGPGRA